MILLHNMVSGGISSLIHLLEGGEYMDMKTQLRVIVIVIVRDIRCRVYSNRGRGS